MTRSSLNGFTLIETLLYIALLGLILGSVSTFMVWVLKVNVKVRAMEEVISNAERAKDVIVQETRQAVSLYTPTTTSSQLSLESQVNTPAQEAHTFVDFFLCGTSLCKKTEGQNPIAITGSSVQVSSFQVTEIANESIRIHLVVDYPNPENRPERVAQQDITFTVTIR